MERIYEFNVLDFACNDDMTATRLCDYMACIGNEILERKVKMVKTKDIYKGDGYTSYKFVHIVKVRCFMLSKPSWKRKMEVYNEIYKGNYSENVKQRAKRNILTLYSFK